MIQSRQSWVVQSSGKWGLAAASEVRGTGGFWQAWVLPLMFAGSLALGAGVSLAKQDGPTEPRSSEAPTANLASLPPEAAQTHRLIHQGGPFPYEKDGTVFGNRERRLPQRERGHYREYTVPTPGARDRGARRIVCGGAVPVRPDACFYTADHYASFSRIVQ